MKKWFIGVIALVCASAAISATPTPWQQITHPIAGTAKAIGSFTNGCVIGAAALPQQSPHYQVMRPDRQRYFGHPDLLAFIHQLARQVYQRHQSMLLIGDMAMPAGGRFGHGHTSHQSGLDVDIWLQLPRTPWSLQQLLTPQPLDLVMNNGRQVKTQLWQPQLVDLIRLAAKNERVTRIFVHAAIKKQLCHDAGTDRHWLRKIRPWFGHRAHMHIRLRCPETSLECVDQEAPPPGDGCDTELESWLVTRPPDSAPQETALPPLPVSCQALLDSHFPVK